VAKIVYGLSGEGSGHSSRAIIIIPHLIKKGHIVRVASYGRGYENLKDLFDVTQITGINFVTEDNKLSVAKTLAQNIATLPEGQESLSKLKKTLFTDFKPDCVFCDFEPMTAYLANFLNIPLVSLDNQHRIRYLDYNYPSDMRADALVAENIVRAAVPRPDVSLITSFYEGKLRNNRSFLFPPILREEVINTRPIEGNHILVYLTRGFDSLVDILRLYHREKFIIYGYKRSDQLENLVFKEFSSEGFLCDLANSKAVIGTAGFTLITESLFLRKPYLAVPMKGQFEQELNGYVLESLSYGKSMPRLSRDIVSAFLYEIPEYKEKLKQYSTAGNDLIKEKIDSLLTNDMKELLEYHNKRSLVNSFQNS